MQPNAKNPGLSRGFVPEGRQGQTVPTPLRIVHSTLLRPAQAVAHVCGLEAVAQAEHELVVVRTVANIVLVAAR